jgi:hypothetical protein
MAGIFIQWFLSPTPNFFGLAQLTEAVVLLLGHNRCENIRMRRNEAIPPVAWSLAVPTLIS